MKNIFFILLLICFSVNAGWLKNLYQRTTHIGCTRSFHVDTTLESTSTSTGAIQCDGGVSVDSSIWCGKNVTAKQSIVDSAKIGLSGSVIKQFWKDGDSLKVLIGSDTLAWKPD